MKKGKFITFTQKEMNEIITKKHTPKYGIYYCKIYKSNTENDLLFGFIKHHEYTHEDIEIAIILELKIEMIETVNNAYVYEKDALVPMNRIFGDYIDYCFELKKINAPFGKPLLSQLWGTLSEKTKHYRIVKEDDEPIIVSENYVEQTFKELPNGKFQIGYGDTGNVFVHNWARIGTFLTSMARNKLAKFLLPNLDDCVYAHTDGFILKHKLITDKPFTNELHGLKYEGYNKNIIIKNCKMIENNKKINYEL